jgi:hypothetical protein
LVYDENNKADAQDVYRKDNKIKVESRMCPFLRPITKAKVAND